MKNPYKTLSSKIVHQNPWFKVRCDRLIRPDGSKGEFYVVSKVPFVAVAPIDAQNNIYLVGQYRYAVKKYSWEIPQGNIDENETPLKAAKRELLEETGIIAKKWTKIGCFTLAGGHHNQICHVFLAQKLSCGSNNPDAGEFLKIKKLPLKKFEQLIKSGKIHDGPTLASWCKIKSKL